MLELVTLTFAAITAVIRACETVRANKRVAALLRSSWHMLDAQLRDLHALGRLDGARAAPLRALKALADETTDFLCAFAKGGRWRRTLNHGADRDCFADLTARLQSTSDALALGLSIAASATRQFQMDAAHALDTRELLEALSAMQAGSDPTHASLAALIERIDAVRDHLLRDAQPRSTRATDRLRALADAPTTLVAREVRVVAGRPIGSGAYETVRLADYHGLRVAVKQKPADDERAARALLRELGALQRLRHPHVVQLLGLVDAEEAGQLWTVLEFAPHGSLERVLCLFSQAERDDALGAAPSLPGATVSWLRGAAQLATAVAFLHARGVVHGDLKPANVLVFLGGLLKVSDFGLATVAQTMRTAGLTGGATGAVGTVAYAAPRAGRGGRMHAEDDVYSLALVFAQMLSGEVPFHAHAREVDVARGVEAGVRPALFAGAPAAWRTLLVACWADAAEARPAAAAARDALIGWLCAEEGRARLPLPPYSEPRADAPAESDEPPPPYAQAGAGGAEAGAKRAAVAAAAATRAAAAEQAAAELREAAAAASAAERAAADAARAAEAEAAAAAEGAAAEAKRRAAAEATRAPAALAGAPDDALDALCLYVGMSRAQLLAADRLNWTGKGIAGVSLRVEGMAVLLKRSANLTWLDHDRNSLGDEGACTLSGGLEGNKTLATLGLCHNGIGDVGAAALAGALPSLTGLTKLALSSNQIGDVGAAALAGALPFLTGLTHLSLSDRRDW